MMLLMTMIVADTWSTYHAVFLSVGCLIVFLYMYVGLSFIMT